jgi:predicted nucleotidyltransferase
MAAAQASFNGLSFSAKLPPLRPAMSNSIIALREALAPHADRIKAAFVYGSTAKGEETARSDIDLIVVGEDVTYSDFFDGFLKAEELLRRPVHAFFFSPNEWKGRLTQGSAFFTKINAQPKVFVMGSPEDLAA